MGQPSPTGSAQTDGVIPRSTAAAGVMWIAAAVLAAALAVTLSTNPDIGSTPFMLVILAFCFAGVVSGVGLLRELDWAYDSVSDLSGVLIAATLVYVPFTIVLPEARGFFLLVVVSFAFAVYSLSTLQSVETRRRFTSGARASLRIRRYPRVAGAALQILGVSELWAVLRFADRAGFKPMVGFGILFWAVAVGMGIGLLLGMKAKGPVRVFSETLLVGAVIDVLLHVVSVPLGPSSSTWERLSGVGRVFACFVVAWYSIACVKQAQLEDANGASTLPV